MITSAQCRAARALLQWTQETLSDVSGIGLSTVKDFENGSRKPIARNIEAMTSAFEKAGIEFISNNGGGAGVRFNQP